MKRGISLHFRQCSSVWLNRGWILTSAPALRLQYVVLVARPAHRWGGGKGRPQGPHFESRCQCGLPAQPTGSQVYTPPSSPDHPRHNARTYLSVEVDEIKSIQTHLHLDLCRIHLLCWGGMETRSGGWGKVRWSWMGPWVPSHHARGRHPVTCHSPLLPAKRLHAYKHSDDASRWH